MQNSVKRVMVASLIHYASRCALHRYSEATDMALKSNPEERGESHRSLPNTSVANPG
ncbi:hypothetical protein ASPBRDRAFT_349490 [Aspergillus brasiliensis CBS 101740]|uniref:Uncharacterized protein n=1 Tax=Aspergillus brasiliensis (strain CBS 101740 / IMI 381727 / IBT 21946) TaxID=767769 RepID=A0A1L9U642_ASPBC|nr:hypothetical protein ASPBRDRAFT_349490 [Aspergillus brasiliensis CBS 101740]